MVLRKVQQVKEGMVIYLPKLFTDELNIKKGDMVDIHMKNDKLTIEKPKTKKEE